MEGGVQQGRSFRLSKDGAGMPDEIQRSMFCPRVQSRAQSLQSKLIAIRRDLHRQPELSNREFRTSSLVADYLKGLGLQVQTGVAHTGVVGLLKGEQAGPVFGVRVDMDALPIQE